MPKCRDCGLLFVRDPADRSPPREATTITRTQGTVGSGPRESGRAYPGCYAGIRSFDQEALTNAAMVAASLAEEIDCARFVQYRPGRSPQEHEMLTLVQQAREYQAQTDARIERHHQETLAQSRRQHRQTMLMSLLIALITSSIVSTLIAGLIAHWFARG